MSERGPVLADAEVLSIKRVGAYSHLTVVAAGVAERFRPGTAAALSIGDAMSARLMRRTLPIYRARPTGAYGGTVELVFGVEDEATRWLSSSAAGTRLSLIAPLGRPFALPKDPVACLLVGEGAAAAPLFGLAERLRERGCTVHMVLSAGTEAELFGALEARRTAKTVTVTTADGSVGMTGTAVDVLPQVLGRTAADVVYAAGSMTTLHGVAQVAESQGAWSQTALDVPMPCGTGVCQACVVPVVGEDGVHRTARACAEGPVFRGDRVRWDDLAAAGAHR